MVQIAAVNNFVPAGVYCESVEDSEADRRQLLMLTMADGSLSQKCGYLDIKESSRVKGRKLKTWRRRWVVVTKIADLSAGTLAAKVDLYPDDPDSRHGRGRASERMTFVLDGVTAIQRARSKTHPNAFEIVEAEPVLVLSGSSELESNLWLSALRYIFFTDDSESFTVSIQPNRDADRLGLKGQYCLRVCSQGLTLATPASSSRGNTLDRVSARSDLSTKGLRSYQSATETNSAREGFAKKTAAGGTMSLMRPGDREEVALIEWKFAMLKRFNVDVSGRPWIFELDCGPNSPGGEATFLFLSKEAQHILASIRKYISVAMAMRQSKRPETKSRTESISTASFQALLDNSHSNYTLNRGLEKEGSAFAEETRTKIRTSRSDSESSTVTPTSPASSTADVTANADCDGEGLPVHRKQRISVTSFGDPLGSSPSGPLGSSPGGRTMDMFGSTLQHQQEMNMQQWQQTQMWQQQGNSPLVWNRQQQQFQPLQQVLPWIQQFFTPELQNQHQMGWAHEVQQQVQQVSHRQRRLSLGSRGMSRNLSVPNVITFTAEDNGFNLNDNEDFMRQRTSSVTTEQRPRASESVCSGDSGVVVTDRGSRRRGSNSFDSTVSTASSVSARKTSDGVEPILEFLPSDVAFPAHCQCNLSEDKATQQGSSCHIYQELDAVRAEAARTGRRLSSFGQGLERRRHSTGEVRKENDYEEVGGLNKGIMPAASVATVDRPPELPARPASFLLGKAKAGTKDKLSLASGLSVLKDKRSDDIALIDRPRASRSNSIDPYSTIPDFDCKLTHRRGSSDTTLSSSHPDIIDLPALPPKTRPAPTEWTLGMYNSSASKNIASITSDSASGSVDLLTFSDDIPSRNEAILKKRNIHNVLPDLTIDSKAALIDFFLNDATFHTNPMVTGNLKNVQSFEAPSVDTGLRPRSFREQSMAAAFPTSQGGTSHGLRSFDPWQVTTHSDLFASSFTLPSQPESPTSTGITARVEGVYIDMRKNQENEEEEGGGYVRAECMATEQDDSDFLLFQ